MEHKELMQVTEAVENINNIIFTEFNGSDNWNGTPFSMNVKTNGYSTVVVFLGETLWNSDDDARKFDGELDDYEPMESFLLQEVLLLLMQLGLIKQVIQEEYLFCKEGKDEKTN